MWARVVVELDPVTDHASGMLLTFEAVPMHALLLQGADDSLTIAFCREQHGVMNSCRRP
jgi:hypothetical protein